MKRRILITGFAHDSRTKSPVWSVHRRGFEVWSFNNDAEQFEYSARHFEMHDLAVYGEKAVDDVSPDEKYLARLRDGLGMPVYMLRAHEHIPGSVAYPIEAITRELGTYLTNSISYMLALAIHERVDEVHLYGIDMAREHEHGWERPSIEYFLGVATGRGILVRIAKQSDMLKCLGLYGYIDVYELEAQARELRARFSTAAARYEEDAATYRGAAENIDWFLRRGVLPGDQGHATNEKLLARKRWLLLRARTFRSNAGIYRKYATRQASDE